MVLPMFVMLGELLHQRKELFDIIQRKDMEIQDYRDQGVTASRSECTELSIISVLQIDFQHAKKLTI